MPALLRPLTLSLLTLCPWLAHSTTVPDYVTSYAPLVHLDVNELYLPSDIGAQLLNTHPELNFTRLLNATAALDLSDLSSLNALVGCSVDEFDDCDIYLTSRTNATSDPRPAWLYGVLPDPVTGETEGVVSTAVVVTDHGAGLVDAYYFYFYAFNLGLVVGGVVLGNHVGDWEHTMVRFLNGQPQAVWLSAHETGNAYSYSAMSKNGSRPIVYASIGGHANYPTPGLHSRPEGLITLNDTTSMGPLWDPTLSAYYFTFTPTSSVNGTFQPASAANSGGSPTQPPTDWLSFLGKWGDKQYPAGYPDQLVIGDISATYQDGPTGPLDKDLNRTNTCPDSVIPCNTTSVLPIPSGTVNPVMTISRTIMAPTYATSSTSAAPSSFSATSSAPAPAGTNSAMLARVAPSVSLAALGVVFSCVLCSL